MADKEIIHHHDSGDGGSSGIGAILGVIVGAVLVVGMLYGFATYWDRGGGESKVSINMPAAPSAPSMPRPAPSGPTGSP
jgi:hypothetical protein